MAKLSIFLSFLTVLLSDLFPQTTTSDSIPRHSLQTVVITADKFPNNILTSTSAVNIITIDRTVELPAKNFYEVLSLIPGISINDKNGLGFDPIISMRGFYGGGEAEYVLVFVDGVQNNDLETGLINWNFLDINNIEVVRGGSSALYGDAAIGGVINITTKKQSKSFFARAGSYNSYSGGINYSSLIKNNLFNFYLIGDQSKGFRENSDWFSLSFGGNYFVDLTLNSFLKFSSNNQIINYDEPGPILEGQFQNSEDYSMPLYKSDNSKERRYNFYSEYSNQLSKNENLKFQLGFKHKNSENTNTFTNIVPIVDPQTFNPMGVYDTSLFGDTKKRELSINEIRLSGNYFSNLNSIKTRFTIGADANFGFYTSKYFNVFNGFEEDYENLFSEQNKKINDVKGNRQDYAAYINNEFSPYKKLKLNFGLRFDQINDDYKSTIPDSSIKISNSALSPKAGINLLFAEGERYSGSIYANYNKAFKAPTIDQLTNLNQLDFGVFVPVAENQFMFFPFQAEPFANSNLKPQKSATVEFGSYNIIKILNDLSAEISATVYQSDVSDEIDFDLSTFRYENIDKTRHRGLESGINFNFKNSLNGFLNYTINEVKFRSGNYENNFVKGIPENILSAGVRFSDILGFYTGITFNSYSNIFLDDENSAKLNDFNTTGIRIGYKYKKIDFQIDVKNLFDKKYNSIGYLLNGEKYSYPAAGRTFYGGVKINLE